MMTVVVGVSVGENYVLQNVNQFAKDINGYHGSILLARNSNGKYANIVCIFTF